jgi:hypothetical protein
VYAERVRRQKCANVKQYQRQITTYIREAKDVPCADCGQRYHYCMMDFDPRDPEDKLFTIGRGCNSLPKMKLEITKCDVVCSNCHRLRTWNEKIRLREKNAISELTLDPTASS